MELNAWDLSAVGIKAIMYAATLCAGGGVFFLIYNAPMISIDQRGKVRRWIGLCVVIGILLSMIRIIIVAGSMSDGLAGVADGTMIRMVLQAGEGRATGIRIVGLALAGTVAFSDRAGTAWALLGAFLAATSFAWIGHAWADTQRGLTVLMSLHLSGVAFWLGALVPLLMIVRDDDSSRPAQAVARFGNAAIIVVLVLIAAGALVLCNLLTHVSDLWTDPYGRTATIKLGLVACLLSLAALNKLRLTPRLLNRDPRAVQHLIRSIRLEMSLGGLILIATAILTTLMGPPTLE